MKTKKPAGEGKTIGLDLGDRRHAVCVLDEAGEIVAEDAITLTRAVLTAFCVRFPGATIHRDRHALAGSRVGSPRSAIPSFLSNDRVHFTRPCACE